MLSLLLEALQSDLGSYLYLIIATGNITVNTTILGRWKKKALESYSWKQEKVSTSSSAMASQNKVNTFPAASSAKIPSSKSSLFPTSKKQSNSLQIDLSSKLASNCKLTSDKCEKHLENNLYLYYDARDYKLNSCPKKQTTVTLKSHSALATTNILVAASKKPLEK